MFMQILDWAILAVSTSRIEIKMLEVRSSNLVIYSNISILFGNVLLVVPCTKVKFNKL